VDKVSVSGSPALIEYEASADPVSWPSFGPSRAINRICKATPVDRETSAANALRQAIPHALEVGDALVDPLGPLARESRPVATCRYSIGWELGQLPANFLQ
jgi:hypothetical protein